MTYICHHLPVSHFSVFSFYYLFVRSEAKDNICLRTMKKNRSRDYLRFSVRTRDRYPINIDCDFDY